MLRRIGGVHFEDVLLLWTTRSRGAAKAYVCHQSRGGYGAGMGRDVNGAKNVFLKNYGALGITVTPCRVVSAMSGFGAYPL